VAALKARGYRPAHYYETNPDLRAAIDLISDGFFSRGDVNLFRPFVDGLMHWDPYLVFADFQAYSECQTRVDSAFQNVDRWTAMSILNVARSGKFSSDRTILEYVSEIWRAPKVPIRLLSQKDLTTTP
jgi:starch phosphorylase